MKLSELVSLMEQVEAEAANPETGELPDPADWPPELRQRLEAIEGEIETKKLSVAHYITYLREDEERLRRRLKSVTRKKDWLRDYLMQHMDDDEKVKDDLVTASIQKRREVEVVSYGSIPDEYFKHTPDKTAIGKALRAGEDVPGAELVERKVLVIR